MPGWGSGAQTFSYLCSARCMLATGCSECGQRVWLGPWCAGQEGWRGADPGRSPAPRRILLLAGGCLCCSTPHSPLVLDAAW